LHLFFTQMFSVAPNGYEFVFTSTAWDKMAARVIGSNWAYFTFQQKVLSPLLPPHLVKAYLEGIFRKPPQDVALTYSIGHVIFRKEPWIVQLEWAHQLTGFCYKHLERYGRIVETLLASPYCRRVLCWSELAKKSVLSHLNCGPFLEKIEVVPYGTPPHLEFSRTHKGVRLRLLFVGSGNRPGEFFARGGNVALEAFRILATRYPNLELLIASDMPQPVKNRCRATPGVTVLDGKISDSQRTQEQLYADADIFIFPGHLTPLTIFEAMSYELPVIATDVYATSEIVEHGMTGFLIRPADHVPYYVERHLPTGPGDSLNRQFRRAVEKLDPEMVRDLVVKTAVLIEDPHLRTQMGKAARWQVEHGKFSMALRQDRLKRIFDEATASTIPVPPATPAT
jgi:glycosyltransferase involved in cell wall biosynthesis